MPRSWLNCFSPTTARTATTAGVNGPFAACLPIMVGPTTLELCARDPPLQNKLCAPRSTQRQRRITQTPQGIHILNSEYVGCMIRTLLSTEDAATPPTNPLWRRAAEVAPVAAKPCTAPGAIEARSIATAAESLIIWFGRKWGSVSSSVRLPCSLSSVLWLKEQEMVRFNRKTRPDGLHMLPHCSPPLRVENYPKPRRFVLFQPRELTFWRSFRLSASLSSTTPRSNGGKPEKNTLARRAQLTLPWS